MADLITRQAAIEAIDKIFPADPMRNDYTQGITCGAALAEEYIKQLPPAQADSKEMSSTHKALDCISRQDAIDALEKVVELYPWRVPGDRDSYSKYNEAWNDALDRAESEIEALPSAQSERKKGKWINVRHDNIAECDQCGITGRAWMNFCFDCGADMREGAERRTDDND